MKRTSFVAAAVAGSLVFAAPAAAAPVNAPHAEITTLVCENGQSYEIAVAPGNGEWTPGIMIGGGGVALPFGFGPSTFTVTDARGAVIETDHDPTVSEKQNAHRHNLISCDLSLSFTEDGLTFRFDGTVLVKIVGRR